MALIFQTQITCFFFFTCISIKTKKNIFFISIVKLSGSTLLIFLIKQNSGLQLAKTKHKACMGDTCPSQIKNKNKLIKTTLKLTRRINKNECKKKKYFFNELK